MTPSSGASAPDPSSILERVRGYAAQNRLLRSTRRLVVAVSGGADSVCLLAVLKRIESLATRRMVVVHIDHQLRPDSANDAQFVSELAARLGIPSVIERVDVSAFVRESGLGLEHSARILRYRALARAAQRHDAGAIATGHTVNDSVETVIMHFIRGSGPAGLRGMLPRQPLDPHDQAPADASGAPESVWLIRPLLCVTRADTVAYCQASGLVWRDDPTNLDSSFLRNRVRNHLLPVLRTYNPRVDEAIARLSDVVRQEEDWAGRYGERVWRRLAQVERDAVVFRRASFLRHPVAIRRRLLLRAVSLLGLDPAGVSFEGVERIMTYVREPRDGQLAVRAGIVTSAPDRVEIRAAPTNE